MEAGQSACRLPCRRAPQLLFRAAPPDWQEGRYSADTSDGRNLPQSRARRRPYPSRHAGRPFHRDGTYAQGASAAWWHDPGIPDHARWPRGLSCCCPCRAPDAQPTSPRTRLSIIPRILSLERRFGRERLEAACDRALTHNTISYVSVKSILVTGLDKAAMDPATVTPTPRHDNIRGATYYQ